MSQSLTIFFKNPKLLALDDTADLLVNRFTLNGTRYLAAIGHFCGFAGLFYCFVTAGKLFRRVSIRGFLLLFGRRFRMENESVNYRIRGDVIRLFNVTLSPPYLHMT
jgi:hypothetical protein